MPTVRVRIEEEDLHDMLGNLIDNACKWAHHRVEIHITATGDVFIDDDGPGVPPEQWPHLGQRGQRLDEHTPGSGLGLAIVTELVEVYEAQLRFDRSPLGGLRVHLSGLNSCG
jgi:signal transduction histidine kinase